MPAAATDLPTRIATDCPRGPRRRAQNVAVQTPATADSTGRARGERVTDARTRTGLACGRARPCGAARRCRRAGVGGLPRARARRTTTREHSRPEQAAAAGWRRRGRRWRDGVCAAARDRTAANATAFRAQNAPAAGDARVSPAWSADVSLQLRLARCARKVETAFALEPAVPWAAPGSHTHGTHTTTRSRAPREAARPRGSSALAAAARPTRERDAARARRLAASQPRSLPCLSALSLAAGGTPRGARPRPVHAAFVARHSLLAGPPRGRRCSPVTRASARRPPLRAAPRRPPAAPAPARARAAAAAAQR